MSTRSVTSAALTVLALLTFNSRPLSARDDSPLRYDWQPAQEFAYRVKIIVDLPEETETYQGTIHYTVKSVTDDNRLVAFRGGLPKSTKWKASRHPGDWGPFRGRIGPPPVRFLAAIFEAANRRPTRLPSRRRGM